MKLAQWNEKQRGERIALKKLARKLNCTLVVELCGGTFSAELTAPGKHRFSEGLHQLVDVTNQPWLPDFQDMKDRLVAYGVEPCDIPDCEWCNSEDEA